MQTVGTTVRSVEVTMSLEDEVCLSRDPPFRGVGVLEECVPRCGGIRSTGPCGGVLCPQQSRTRRQGTRYGNRMDQLRQRRQAGRCPSESLRIGQAALTCFVLLFPSNALADFMRKSQHLSFHDFVKDWLRLSLGPRRTAFAISLRTGIDQWEHSSDRCPQST